MQLLEITLARGDHILGHDPLANDLLLVIHVVDEHVQRANPLLEPRLDHPPLGFMNDPWNQIKGPNLFCAGCVPVDVERNAHVQEFMVGRSLTLLEFAKGQ